MPLYNFIFSNKTGVRILRHAVFWFCWYMYSVMLFLYNNNNVQANFWLNLEIRCVKLLKVSPIAMCTCYLFIYLLIPSTLYKKKFFLFTCGAILLLVAEMYFINIVTYHRFDISSVWVGIVSTLSRGGPLIWALFLTIKTLKTWYIKEYESDLLIKANLNAELQLLKAQVHPHFLFNTLNNIYAFILLDPLTAKSLVKKLEKLLRYMINECEQPLVPLSEEISMINDYLELEKVRYGNRLQLQVQIEKNCKNKMVTPLLMIPFIENSFKHGASKLLQQPWIKLFIQADEDVLHFTLANNKPENRDTPAKEGIGLNNVKRRLTLLFPQGHLLVIQPTKNTYTVNMQIPLFKAGEIAVS